MTRKILSMLLVVLMLGASLATTVNATSFYGIEGNKSFEVPYVTENNLPTINGALDEGEWDAALEIDISYDNLSWVAYGAMDSTIMEGSKMYMCWNEKGLYFAVRVIDSCMSAANPTKDGPLNQGDGIQLAIYANDDAIQGQNSENLFWDFLPFTGPYSADEPNPQSFEHFIHNATTPNVALASEITEPNAEGQYTYTMEWCLSAADFAEVTAKGYKLDYNKGTTAAPALGEGTEFTMNVVVMDADKNTELGDTANITQSLGYLDDWRYDRATENFNKASVCDYFILSGKEVPLSVTPAANGAWAFNVPKLNGTINIDGTIEEDAWKNALQIDISSDALSYWSESYNEDSYIQKGSYAYVAWTEAGLYLAFDVYDTCANPSNPDGKASNGGDTIQLALYKGDGNYDQPNKTGNNMFWDIAAFMGAEYQNPTAAIYEHFFYHAELETNDYAALGIELGSTTELPSDWETLESGFSYRYCIEVLLPASILKGDGFIDDFAVGNSLAMNICVLNQDDFGSNVDAGMITPEVVWDRQSNNTFTLVEKINKNPNATLVNSQTSLGEYEEEEEETDPPATAKPTEAATKTEPVTQAPQTQAATQAAATEATEEGGCGSVIGVGAIAVVACMAAAGVMVFKKKED